MKSVLGSLFAMMLLFAENFEVNLTKESLYLKEPLVVTLSFYPDKIKEIDWVKFEPIKKSSYEFHTLKKESLKNGYRFYYLLFPLKSGKVSVDYNLTYKRAPFKEIQNKILGTGYEQTTPIEGKIYSLKVAPSQIVVKKASAQLFGSYSLNLKTDGTKKEAFEPVYATLTLKGTGYPPKLTEPLPNPGVLKVLKDRPQKKITYTKEGANIEYVYSYALINDKNFTIPSITLKEFDYKEYKVLKTAPIHITITSPTSHPDKEDFPPKIEPVATSVFTFLKYMLIFLSGMATALVILLLFGRRLAKIKDIVLSDARELLALLTLRYPNRFKKEKEMLNDALREGKKINIVKIKFRVLKELR